VLTAAEIEGPKTDLDSGSRSHPLGGGGTGSPASLARSELLSDHSPERLLERLTLPVHVLSQSDIDESLVVTAAGCMDLPLEPFDEVIVQTNGDASLSRRHRNHRTPLSLAEVVFFSHRPFS
jgi:hypothetical protein